MYLACYCEEQYPIEPLLKELQAKDVVYEMREEGGQLSLWLQDPALTAPVAQAYEAYKQGYRRQKQHTLTFENIKQLPITTSLIVISLVVALLTQLGEQFLDWFFIAQIQYYPRSWIPYEGLSVVWHSISPIFLHFGVEHLVFNSLSCWYLGSVLERRMSFITYMGLILVVALISNYCQLWLSGPLFGGLSGVAYGLIGFAFGYQQFYRNLMVPKGLFYLAIGWLVLGYTPIFQAVGLGSMANAAHLSGLLSGAALFFVYFMFVKKSHYGY